LAGRWKLTLNMQPPMIPPDFNVELVRKEGDVCVCWCLFYKHEKNSR